MTTTALFRWPLFLWGIGAMLIWACQPSSDSLLPGPERPRDPWVIRSVLDQRPRMITVALDSLCYVAYDATQCNVYKVWQGGIQLDGAAYTNVKTVQPTSRGVSYAVDSVLQSHWKVLKGNTWQTYTPLFKGYRLKDNWVIFHYALVHAPGDTIHIWERPAWTGPEASGSYFFSRHFTTENVPGNVEVQLNTLGQKWDLVPNGKTEVFKKYTPSSETLRRASTSNQGHRGKNWLERSGCNTCHEEQTRTIGPSYQQIAERYENSSQTVQRLVQKVKQGGKGVWGEVPMIAHPQHREADIATMVRYILSLDPNPPSAKGKIPRRTQELATEDKPGPKPGFGASLEGLHPSLEVTPLRPAHFKPRVGGMAFLPDSSLLVSTWDSIGAVYRLKNVVEGDTSQIQIERIAEGLHEPLGLTVVGEEIFVLQKQELTQLIDHDGDGITDEYRAICNSWGATADFHEYSYGLAYEDGYFYANLGLAMRLMAHERQHPDRGRTMKISRKTGEVEFLNFGLRQPNGIGWGVDNELFITENQGRWVPANKLMHVQPGAFHGSRASIKDSLPELEMVPPTVWLPQDEIGNSPGEPILMRYGPYQGQMLHGEVTHGGLKRVFLEKIKGVYQGCVFRFTQGLEAGIIRLCYGPNDALYVGGVGMNGNWGWNGAQYGLEKLTYTENVPFEMLAVRAKPEGIEIEFTEPISKITPSDIQIQQWWYLPTEQYGGPKRDLETLSIQQLSLSPDKRKVQLNIPGLKRRHVVYVLLDAGIRSDAGHLLWTGEAWYTLNEVPNLLP